MFPIRDTIPSRNFPLVTWALIVLNALVFLFELSLSPSQLETFFYQFGLVPARYEGVFGGATQNVFQTDFWPFLTMMFVHGGWLHILGNMWFLHLFGDNIEDRMGPVRFLFFYLICGVAAAVIQFVSDPGSRVPSIGASGAIAGVMGAYMVSFPHSRIITLIPILFFPFIVEIPAFFFLGFWALTQLFNVFTIHASVNQTGIAFWAHVGGFAVGILLLPLFTIPQQKPSRPDYADEYRPW